MCTTDEIFIKRCFDLANLAGKATKSNPKVGAVIVHNGIIIGEGYHKKYGGPHAEIEALVSVLPSHKTLITDSAMYVSLEPCSHFGKTPPCANRIIAEGIRKVVVSCTDPNPLVAGQGIKTLRDAGVEVITDVLINEGQKLIAPFRANISGRPYIILKWAKSKDNFIGQHEKQIQLTSKATSVLTHKWRSECDGILIGKNTLITDNPSLTTRSFPGDNPIRILLDSNLEILKAEYQVLTDSFNTIIFNVIKDEVSSNKEFVKISNLKNDLKTILNILYNKGVLSVLVEGGSEVLQSFINQNLWDEARIISTPENIMNGIKAPDLEGVLDLKMNIGPDEVVYVRNKSPRYV